VKNLIIRADAGGVLGTGHIMRMIALAQAYMRRGGNVVIASAQCPSAVVDRVKELGIRHQLLDGCILGDAQDADLTLELCKELGARWMVLDGYHLDETYQKRVSGHGIKVLAIDDYGHCATWHCDAVLNQNLGSENWQRGNSSQPDMQWLLGSSFALIREEFLVSIQRAKEKSFPAQRILVTMGGADVDNVTLTILKSLEHTNLDTLDIRVLAGGANAHQKELQQWAQKSRHQVEILTNVRDMPSMYEWTDAVISAGGSTCWEWLAYGLAGAVVTIAENQEPIVEELKKRELALTLGWPTDRAVTVWKRLLDRWISSGLEGIAYQQKHTVIDGKGADRVASLLSDRLIITIATAATGWLRNSVDKLKEKLEGLGHQVHVVFDAQEIPPSDILFLLSFWSLIPANILTNNTHNIVIHGSDLPKGRGWSPVTWQIIDGENKIPMTLFEATEKVDAGDVYLKSMMVFLGDELLDEIQEKQALAQFDLCCDFVEHYPSIVTNKQAQIGDSFTYPRRSSKDSMLDVNKTIHEQFNILRTVDNDNYPAYFEMAGRTYTIKIEGSER